MIRKNRDCIYIDQINLLATDKFEKEICEKTKVANPFKVNDDLFKEYLSDSTHFSNRNNNLLSCMCKK